MVCHVYECMLYSKIDFNAPSLGLSEVRRSKVTNAPLKSPREISNRLYINSGYVRNQTKLLNLAGLFFGQYIAYDASYRVIQQIGDGGPAMRCCSADYTERLSNQMTSYGCMAIDIPANDKYYSQYNMTCMEFIRAAPVLPQNCELGAVEPVIAFTYTK